MIESFHNMMVGEVVMRQIPLVCVICFWVSRRQTIDLAAIGMLRDEAQSGNQFFGEGFNRLSAVGLTL